MRGKLDPQLTKEISHRFVELVETHLRLSWTDLAKLLGYSNRTTLDAVKGGRTIPGPDKLYTLARWISPDGNRANIDWIFTSEGSPLIDTKRQTGDKFARHPKHEADVEIEQLPTECRAALAHLVRTLRQPK